MRKILDTRFVQILNESERMVSVMKSGPEKEEAEEFLSRERLRIASIFRKACKYLILSSLDNDYDPSLSVHEKDGNLFIEMDTGNSSMRIDCLSGKSAEISEDERAPEMI